MQESQQSLSDTIEAQPSNDQRAIVLGVDRHGYSYIYFQLFCGADLRVYRQKFEELADSEPESPPMKVCVNSCFFSASFDAFLFRNLEW